MEEMKRPIERSGERSQEEWEGFEDSQGYLDEDLAEEWYKKCKSQEVKPYTKTENLPEIPQGQEWVWNDWVNGFKIEDDKHALVEMGIDEGEGWRPRYQRITLDELRSRLEVEKIYQERLRQVAEHNKRDIENTLAQLSGKSE